MPNIKSAIKRVSVIEKKTLRNNMIKSGYRTAVRKFEEAIDAKDVKSAETTAARKKSRLAKKLNAVKA